MSEQEFTQGDEERGEQQMQDLDVSEEQQDDVVAGALGRGTDDPRYKK